MNKLHSKIFCDESCHLQHDKSGIMVLGAICCLNERLEMVLRTIKYLRHKHNYNTELKWTKLIARQMPFYSALIDLFVKSDLQFKATVVLNKGSLRHDEFNNGSHTNFYYKMFYYTIKDFFPDDDYCYRLYLDYMDTQGLEKCKKLVTVLQNYAIGQDRTICVEAQTIRSYESQLIQLCDFFIGALSYKNRIDIEKKSTTKNEVISLIERKIGINLSRGTPPWEQKFNIFQFQPRSINA